MEKQIQSLRPFWIKWTLTGISLKEEEVNSDLKSWSIVLMCYASVNVTTAVIYNYVTLLLISSTQKWLHIVGRLYVLHDQP